MEFLPSDFLSHHLQKTYALHSLCLLEVEVVGRELEIRASQLSSCPLVSRTLPGVVPTLGFLSTLGIDI